MSDLNTNPNNLGEPLPSDTAAHGAVIQAQEPTPFAQGPTNAEPVEGNSTTNGVVCRACSYTNPAGSFRCRCGCVLAGNPFTRTHALYAANAPELRAIEDAGRRLLDQSLLDAGGRDELSAREVSTHENRALLQTKIWKLNLAFQQHGLFDRRGRLRLTWLKTFESLVTSAASLDRTLGLERRARRLPRSMSEALAQQPEVRDE